MTDHEGSFIFTNEIKIEEGESITNGEEDGENVNDGAPSDILEMIKVELDDDDLSHVNDDNVNSYKYENSKLLVDPADVKFDAGGISTEVDNVEIFYDECLEIKIEEEVDEEESENFLALPNDFTNIHFKEDVAEDGGFLIETNGCNERLIDIENVHGEDLMGVAKLIVQGEKDRRNCRYKNDKNFKCDECGKCYKSEKSREIHSRIHVDPFKCQKCGKCFARSRQLQLHDKFHTNIKPFQCQVCDKRFTHKGRLKQHSVIHDDARPFKCTLCGKAFKYKSHLVEHCRIHSGLRPFKCDICGKSFKQASQAKSHNSIHFKK